MRDIPVAEEEDELQEKSALRCPEVPTPDATATMAAAQAMREASMALTAMPTSMLQTATLQQLATDIVAQAKAQVAMLQMGQNPQEHAEQLQACPDRKGGSDIISSAMKTTMQTAQSHCLRTCGSTRYI